MSLGTRDRSVRVVTRTALAYEADGPRRGWAHIGFDDYPADAPGRLDFDPLRLFAHGRMLPGEGFDLHPHDNVENLLVVRRGRCRHGDSDGGRDILEPGDVLGISAGRGIAHAEHVHGDEPLDALVIWLRPDVRDTPPRIAVRRARPSSSEQRWTVLASGRDGAPPDALALQCDGEVVTARLEAGRRATHWVGTDRRAYVAVFGGRAQIDGVPVGDGDRVLVCDREAVSVHAHDDVDVFLVDVA